MVAIPILVKAMKQGENHENINILSSRIFSSGPVLRRVCQLEPKMAVITDKYGLYSLFNYVILLLDICRIGEKLRYCRKLQYLSVLEFSWKNIMPCFTQYSQCDCYRYDFMKIFVFLNFTTIYTYVLIKNIILKLRNFKKTK